MTPLNIIYRVVISPWLTQYSQLNLTIQHPARRPRRVERVVGMCPSGSTTWLTGGKGQTRAHKALVTIPNSVSHSMLRVKSDKTIQMETTLNVLYSVFIIFCPFHFSFTLTQSNSSLLLLPDPTHLKVHSKQQALLFLKDTQLQVNLSLNTSAVAFNKRECG